MPDPTIGIVSNSYINFHIGLSAIFEEQERMIAFGTELNHKS